MHMQAFQKEIVHSSVEDAEESESHVHGNGASNHRHPDALGGSWSEDGNATQKGPRWDSNREPSGSEATVLTSLKS